MYNTKGQTVLLWTRYKNCLHNFEVKKYEEVRTMIKVNSVLISVLIYVYIKMWLFFLSNYIKLIAVA